MGIMLMNESKRRLVLDGSLDPWGRQPGETPVEFERFAVYRDMGMKRSLKYLSQIIQVPAHALSKICNKNQWAFRVSRYDKYLDDLVIEQNREIVLKRRKEHLEMAKRLISVGKVKIEKLLKIDKKLREEQGLDVDSLAELISPAEARLMVIEGIKLERICVGEADTITEHRFVVEAPAIEDSPEEWLAKYSPAGMNRN